METTLVVSVSVGEQNVCTEGALVPLLSVLVDVSRLVEGGGEGSGVLDETGVFSWRSIGALAMVCNSLGFSFGFNVDGMEDGGVPCLSDDELDDELEGI